MSWIKENKFAATLAGITVVGSAALLYLSIQQSGAEEDMKAKTKKLTKEEVSLKSSVPYPSKENLKSKKDAVIAYSDAAKSLQDELVLYRPEDMGQFQPAEFAPMLDGFRTELDGLFEDAGTKVPEKMFYGFRDYASKLPEKAATGKLKYKLDATKWLFSELAKANPKSLFNVYRAPLAVEGLTKVVEEEEERRPRRRSRSRNSRKPAPKAENSVAVYEAQPIELSFSIKEKDLFAFMEKLANSKEYFYSVRAVRIMNEDQKSPSKSSAQFEEEEVAGGSSQDFDLGGGGLLDGGDAEPEAAPVVMMAKGERILKRILGAENVLVVLKLDLLVFDGKDKVLIPGSKAAMKTDVEMKKEDK